MDPQTSSQLPFTFPACPSVTSSYDPDWDPVFHTPKTGGVLDNGNLYKTMSSQEYCDKHFAGRYDDSKLFDVFFHRALDDRLGPKSPVIVNGAHPGFCYSELRREFTGIKTIPMFLMERTFAWTSEQGSRQLLYAALGGAGQGKAVEDKFRGAYIAVQQISEASDFVLESQNLQDRHWRDVLDILVKVDPRVEEVVKKYLVPV
ncbi:hypothetical protein H0H93_015100 [Arthromyces matolae]|nr:hypothetical protein H0H93_015100 [Arthromyces matolae]